MIVRIRPELQLEDLAFAAHQRERDGVRRLERAYAAHFGFVDSVYFSYARSALFSLLKTLNWSGRKILCPAYICAVVPYAVTASGNDVRFVDSAADHFLPGIQDWQRAVEDDSAMAVVTPLFGYPVDPNLAGMLRERNPGMFVLFDEAQSFGAKDASGLQCRMADGMLLSLGLGKLLTSLSGGVLLLRDEGLATRVREFRDRNGVASGPLRTTKLLATALAAKAVYSEPAATLADVAARRFRGVARLIQSRGLVEDARLPADSLTTPSPFEAAIGTRELERLHQVIDARRVIGNYYEGRLKEEGFATFQFSHTPTWPRYPLSVAERDNAVAQLSTRGIQVGLFIDYECTSLPLYRAVPRARNAVRWGESMINLPNWHGMSISDAERVVTAVRHLPPR